MKIYSFFLIVLFFSCSPRKDNKNENISLKKLTGSILKFEKDTIDVGHVMESWNKNGNYYVQEKIHVDFIFTNTGDKPLLINECHGSGCAIGTFSKLPIQPGKTDTIKAFFFRYGSVPGKFVKSLSITGTFKGGTKELFISGELFEEKDWKK